MKETDTEMRSKLGELDNDLSLQTEESTGCKKGGQGTQGEKKQSPRDGEMKLGVWGGIKMIRFAKQITSGEIWTESGH